MRLYQVKKLESRCGRGHGLFPMLALLRVSYVDDLSDFAHPRSLPGNSRLQLLGGAAEDVMPGRLQFAANFRVPTDRSDVHGDTISQRVADGLAAKNPAHPVNFEFRVAEFARGRKIGQHGGARR